MAFKLGDVIVDRIQFGYGAKKNGNPMYALTELNEASINITADSTDITDSKGNLVYRKYNGKTGEVSATNAFVNLAVVEALSATDAEIATDSHTIVMPMMQTVKAGSTLDITGYVEGSVVVSALYKGAIDATKTYTLGASATESEFKIANNILTPPNDANEVEYFVAYKKNVKSGAKITNNANTFPKAHELFFKALAVDPCDKENYRACIVHIPEFIPSPEFTLALQGGDSQTMDFNGAILADTCSTEKVMFYLYFVDEVEEAE